MGKPAEIPNAYRSELPQFFVEMGYKTGAEIGVYKGEFSRLLGQVGLKIYAIDSWGVYGGFKEEKLEEPLGQERNYRRACNTLARYDCTIIRKKSMDAIDDFEDRSLDFVYIDANHNLRYVVEDIVEWSKKVKSGGVISGHDWTYVYDVPYAVYACVQKFKIDNFYVLGESRPKQGEGRDKWRSWFWINP